MVVLDSWVNEACFELFGDGKTERNHYVLRRNSLSYIFFYPVFVINIVYKCTLRV